PCVRVNGTSRLNLQRCGDWFRGPSFPCLRPGGTGLFAGVGSPPVRARAGDCSFRARSLPMSHHEHESGNRLGRRQFLSASAAVPALAGMSLSYVSAQELQAAAGKARANEKWGVPGPYPGRVIEVRNPRMIKSDVKNREAIHEAVARGMK